MEKYLKPSELDKRLSLPIGRIEALAKRGKIPAIKLPDGTIRVPEIKFNSWLMRHVTGVI